MSAFRMRFLFPAAAGTVVLTMLCIETAQFLFQQQSAMTSVLRENVTSRRAAVDLESCLYDISALLHDNVDNVSSLNDLSTIGF
jgi:two-component system sensor histidine kinase HydH